MPSSPPSPPSLPALVVFGRALDASLAAAGVVALVDAASAWARGGFGVVATLDVFALGCACAAIASAAWALVALGDVHARTRTRLRPRWFAAGGAFVLALVPLGVLGELDEAGVVTAILLAGAGLVGWLAWRTARTPAAGAGLGWLVGCALAMQLAERTAASVDLGARLRADVVDVPLMLVLVLALGTLPVALVVARLLCVLGGEARSVARPVTLAGVAAGSGLAIAAANLMMGRYLEARMVAFATAFVLLAWAFAERLSQRPRAIRWRHRIAVLTVASGLLVHLAATASPIDGRTWQLASRTMAASELLRVAGISSEGFEALRASLLESPAGREGAAAGEAARAWNREQVARSIRARSVVLVTVDTLRYDHVGYSGRAPAGLTPTLDHLAERSTRFHRAYAQGGWTSLSIPSLMWSLQPEHIRFERVFEDAKFELHFEDEVDPARDFLRAFQSPRSEPAPSLAEVLAKADVTTLAVTNDGFTHYFEPRLGLVRGFAHTRHPRKVLRARDPDAVPFEIPDDVAVDLALELLEEHRGEPVFLWVHLFGPHEPYARWPDALADWTDYQSEVHAVDHEIGRLLDGLDRTGHRSGAAIIVTGDHGEGLGDHGAHGHGLQPYEEGIRVPLLVAVPDGVARDVETPVGLIDLAPTIAAMLGVTEPPESFEGFDLGPALRGEALRRPPVLSETWRLPVKGPARNPHLLTAVDGDSKVVVDLRRSMLAFFDLAQDPDETTNLASSIDAARRDAYLRIAAYALGVHDTPR